MLSLKIRAFIVSVGLSLSILGGPRKRDFREKAQSRLFFNMMTFCLFWDLVTSPIELLLIESQLHDQGDLRPNGPGVRRKWFKPGQGTAFAGPVGGLLSLKRSEWALYAPGVDRALWGVLGIFARFMDRPDLERR